MPFAITSTASSLEAEAKQASAALKKLSNQEGRVTTAYVGEVMHLERYKGEIEKLSLRRPQLE
jgi:predicted DNA-binding protein